MASSLPMIARAASAGLYWFAGGCSDSPRPRSQGLASLPAPSARRLLLRKIVLRELVEALRGLDMSPCVDVCTEHVVVQLQHKVPESPGPGPLAEISVDRFSMFCSRTARTIRRQDAERFHECGLVHRPRPGTWRYRICFGRAWRCGPTFHAARRRAAHRTSRDAPVAPGSDAGEMPLAPP